MNKMQLFFTTTLFIISGCSSHVDSTKPDAVDFSKSEYKSFLDGPTKVIETALPTYHIDEKGSYRVFRFYFEENFQLSNIDDKYRNYCESISGLYTSYDWHSGLCSKETGNANKAIFFHTLAKTRCYEESSCKFLVLQVYAPLSVADSAFVSEISNYGYIDQEQQKAIARKEMKDKQIVAIAQQYVYEQNLVRQIGQKICSKGVVGFTEQITTNKIQIRLLESQKIIWDSPVLWHPCE
jgi:hypothetical protein